MATTAVAVDGKPSPVESPKEPIVSLAERVPVDERLVDFIDRIAEIFFPTRADWRLSATPAARLHEICAHGADIGRSWGLSCHYSDEVGKLFQTQLGSRIWGVPGNPHPDTVLGQMKQALRTAPAQLAYIRSFMRFALREWRQYRLDAHLGPQLVYPTYLPKLDTVYANTTTTSLPYWAFLHLAPKAEGADQLIGFYKSEQDFLRDVITTTTIGKIVRLLAQKHGDKDVTAIQLDTLVRAATNMHRHYYSPDVLKFTSDPDEIVRIYMSNETNSCMSKPLEAYASNVHPTAVYGNAPGLRLCYIELDGRVKARSLVYDNPDNPKDKRWIRIYGDDVLREKLTQMGYSMGNLEGAKLTKIAAQTKRGILMPNTYVCPWLDDQASGDAVYVATHPDWTYLKVVTARYHSNKPSGEDVLHGRPGNGLTGQFANYTKIKDREFEYIVQGKEPPVLNTHTPIEDGSIRCVCCGQANTADYGIFSSVYPHVGRDGILRPQFVCQPCFDNYYREALDVVTNETVSLHVEDVYWDVHHERFLAGFHVLPDGNHQTLYDTGYYHLHSSYTRFLGDDQTDQVDCVAPKTLCVEDWATQGYILKKDAVLDITGHWSLRRNMLVLAEGDDGTKGYIIGDMLDRVFRRDRLNIKNDRLIYDAPRPHFPLTTAALETLHGSLDEDDSALSDFSSVLALSDLIACIHAQVGTRNPEASRARLRDLTAHQLRALCPKTPYDLLRSLVSSWDEITANQDRHLWAQQRKAFRQLFNRMRARLDKEIVNAARIALRNTPAAQLAA